jgi:hypothetical protein
MRLASAGTHMPVEADEKKEGTLFKIYEHGAIKGLCGRSNTHETKE